MKEIKKLDGISVGKLYATIMLFPAALILGVGMIMMNLNNLEQVYSQQTIMLAIFYPVAGFLAGSIGSLFYNIAAKMVGGIKIEFKRP